MASTNRKKKGRSPKAETPNPGVYVAGDLTVEGDWVNRDKRPRPPSPGAGLESVPGTEESYREWVVHQHQYLPFQGFGRVQAPVSVKLTRVYVSLRLRPQPLEGRGALVQEREEKGKGREASAFRSLTEVGPGLEEEGDPTALSISDALDLTREERVSGLVVLGGPGTGKTTVLKHLALSCAQGQMPYLPLLVTLRRVADPDRMSLSEYMARTCRESVPGAMEDFFRQKLQQGGCLVLLDGLDEVAEEGQRRVVARWVLEQRGNYPRNPFVVTCRVAGWREDYLPPEFRRLDIQKFDAAHIRQFARNWCVDVEEALSGAGPPAHQKGEVAATALTHAILGNERLKELAETPLLLSIIALVHRRGALPDRRADLYEACVRFLCEGWDEQRGLPATVAHEPALALLQGLALWMHSQKPEGKGLVPRKTVEAVFTRGLRAMGRAPQEVTKCLETLWERSGLLEVRELGGGLFVEHALDVYGFVHQTFQEYLCARELATSGEMQVLVDHFGEAYWREVTLLCAGITLPGEWDRPLSERHVSRLFQDILQRPDEWLTEHWRFVLAVLDEAQSVPEERRVLDSKTQQAVFDRALAILKRATDPLVAVRAALWLRRGRPEVEGLIRAFREAPGELAKGHLALLLGGTGDAQAIEVLKPHLADTNAHVRYLSALALDLLGIDRNCLETLLMVRVPAGKFTMGGKQGLGKDTPHRVLSTDAFLIDRFPLTNGQYRRFMEAGGYRESRYWSKEGWEWKKRGKVSEPEEWGGPDFRVPSAPVVGISWYEAEAYGHWQSEQTGKRCRMLTEAEWERAARGDGDAREYPWGDEFDAKKCNTTSEDLEPTIGQPSPVGSYPEGISPHGCYDMAGDAWEWTESLYKDGEPYRVLRGGSWLTPPGLARCAVRNGDVPALRVVFVGVRFSRTL